MLGAGALGAVACIKLYERHQMHMAGAEVIRRRLDQLYPQLHIEHDWRSSRAGHQRRYPLVYRIRLHHLWTALNASVGVMGVWLLTAA